LILVERRRRPSAPGADALFEFLAFQEGIEELEDLAFLFGAVHRWFWGQVWTRGFTPPYDFLGRLTGAVGPNLPYGATADCSNGYCY